MVATAGTVVTGAVDPIAEVAREHGLWLISEDGRLPLDTDQIPARSYRSKSAYSI